MPHTALANCATQSQKPLNSPCFALVLIPVIASARACHQDKRTQNMKVINYTSKLITSNIATAAEASAVEEGILIYSKTKLINLRVIITISNQQHQNTLLLLLN